MRRALVALASHGAPPSSSSSSTYALKPSRSSILSASPHPRLRTRSPRRVRRWSVRRATPPLRRRLRLDAFVRACCADLGRGEDDETVAAVADALRADGRRVVDDLADFSRRAMSSAFPSASPSPSSTTERRRGRPRPNHKSTRDPLRLEDHLAVADDVFDADTASSEASSEASSASSSLVGSLLRLLGSLVGSILRLLGSLLRLLRARGSSSPQHHAPPRPRRNFRERRGRSHHAPTRARANSRLPYLGVSSNSRRLRVPSIPRPSVDSARAPSREGSRRKIRGSDSGTFGLDATDHSARTPHRSLVDAGGVSDKDQARP